MTNRPTSVPNNVAFEEIFGPNDDFNLDPDAVVYEFITSGGSTTSEEIDQEIDAGTWSVDSIYTEMLENWVIWVDLTDLREAIVDFFETRPDREQ